MSIKSKRNKIRLRKVVNRQLWRPRRASDVLPAISTALGQRPGSQRCWALGLLRGDCPQPNIRGEAYCFYHMKLYRGQMEPSGELYPVWPLPQGGYVLVETKKEAA